MFISRHPPTKKQKQKQTLNKFHPAPFVKAKNIYPKTWEPHPKYYKKHLFCNNCSPPRSQSSIWETIDHCASGCSSEMTSSVKPSLPASPGRGCARPAPCQCPSTYPTSVSWLVYFPSPHTGLETQQRGHSCVLHLYPIWQAEWLTHRRLPMSA